MTWCLDVTSYVIVIDSGATKRLNDDGVWLRQVDNPRTQWAAADDCGSFDAGDLLVDDGVFLTLTARQPQSTRPQINHYPLEFRRNYNATSNNMKLVHWPLMGGLLHLVQRGGTGRAAAPPRPLLAVPNVTAHPSTASVLLYNDPLFCDFNVSSKSQTAINR